jgi:hypothetical protein
MMEEASVVRRLFSELEHLMPAYPNYIVETPILRDWDRKLYISPHSKFHNGKKCRKLRELTKDDREFSALWNVEIAQSVVELENGQRAVVFHDEVKG